MKKIASNQIAICLVAIFIFSGCAGKYKPPVSPYCQHYENQFEGVHLPDSEAIKNVGTSWVFSKSADEVWSTALYVVQQYEGIIGIDSTKDGEKRLLYVHGQEMPMTPKRPPMRYSRFLDTWVAIAVETDQYNDNSVVYAAWISPDTGEAASIEVPEIKEPKKKKLFHDDNYDSENFESEETEDIESTEKINAGPAKPEHFFEPFRHASALTDIGSALSEERNYITAGISALKEPEERLKWMPLATINEFFYHLSTQLYGPERWMEKYVALYTPPTGPVKSIPKIQMEDDANYIKHQEISDGSGNWMSARLRDAYLVVKCPQIQTLLEEIVTRLKAGAGVTDRETNIYIVASPEINAFSLPNGDIFVCSGLLEALESVDELAAVLAHELDHYFQHDSINRLVKMENARQTQTGIMIAGSVLGGIGGAFAGVAASGSAVATQGMTASGQLLSNVVSNTMSTMSNMVGKSMADSIATGYSQETELRADSNGAKYLWAAGFDPKAELSLLEKLKSKQVEAKERNEPITSGLINAVPGLDKRSEEIKKTLSQLQ